MPSSARHTLRNNGRNTSSVDNVFGRLVMVVAIVEPLMTLPQIVQIWLTKDAHSLSLATWILYVFASLVWFIYGLKIHSKALLITGVLWTIMDAIVVVGIVAWQ